MAIYCVFCRNNAKKLAIYCVFCRNLRFFFGVNFILQKFCPCKKNDKYQVWLTHTPVIFLFGNQENGSKVAVACCVDLIEAQHGQDRYQVAPNSCQNLTALRPASVRQRCLVYLAVAVDTGWSLDARIPCKFSLTPYLMNISWNPI